MANYMANYIKIKDESDNNYLRDEISCFEKSIGIVLDYYIKDASKLYFAFKKITRAYKPESTMYIDEKQFIKDILGLNCYYYSNGENFEQLIETAINNGAPALITGDLINLYYSSFFMEQHHEHLFLVTGYDARKKIYTILDADPWKIYDGSQYISQKIEYSTLEKVCNSDKNQFKGLIEKCNDHNFNYSFALKYCIELYLSTQIHPAVEQEIIDRINNNLADDKYNCDDDISLLVNIPKFKRVGLKELIDLLMKYSSNFSELQSLSELANNMFNLSVDKINMVLKSVYRRRPVDFFEYSSEIITFESEIRKILTNYIDSSQLLKVNIQDECEDEKYIIENNEEAIIQCHTNDRFIFSFGNHKVYNSWTDDCCPKVLFKYNDSSNDSRFVTSVEVYDEFEEVGFLGGIVVKTGDGSVYFWGINSGKHLVLQHCGVNSCIAETPILEYAAELYVDIVGGNCSFGYVSESKLCNIITIKLTDKVRYLGVGSKTWINGEKLTIAFDVKGMK